MELLSKKYFLIEIPMKILLVTATLSEADSVKMVPGIQVVPEGFLFAGHEIIPLVTGVGSVATAWALTKFLSSGQTPDLAINLGIAGSYSDDLETGEVVVPVSDCFADAGVETHKGFNTLAETGLQDPDAFPFRAGKIISDNRFVTRSAQLLRTVNAVTVNTATGSQSSFKMISERYHPDIETMEGAAFFYICSMANVPFLALRSISNKVESRNRMNWNIPLALGNLSVKFKEVILLLE